ncbi:unnamed protein product, partial [marine sediment metagenome]
TALLVALMMAVGVAGYALGVWTERAQNGSTRSQTKRAPLDGRLATIQCLVPMNFLSGKPWGTSLLSEEDAASLLAKEIDLKEGEYDLHAISAEVARSTGKSVLWVPRLSHADEVAKVPIFRVSAEAKEILDRGRGIEIPVKARLSDVLDIVAAFATEVGAGGHEEIFPEDDEPPSSPSPIRIWVVIVTSDTIVFARLPVG